MGKTQPIYTIDTNILVDYPDIIPGYDSSPPDSPTIDLTGAHIVIPSAVVRELSKFKKERNWRGRAARTVLKRLRLILGDIEAPPMCDSYNLHDGVQLTGELGKVATRISVLPVHKNFKKCLPFSPSEDDMDGQIILAALIVIMLENGLPIDGSADPQEVMLLKTPPPCRTFN